MRDVAYAAFFLCSLIWGSTFLFIRIGNESVPPLWAATIRLVLAAAALAALAFATRRRWPRGEALRGAALFGLLNFGLNLSLLYWGELTVPSGIAAVFYATVPLWTALLAALFGLERLAPRKLAAALVALAGVATIFAGELSLDVPLAGLLAILGAAMSASLSSVILKASPKQDTLPLNAVGAVVGAPVCLALSVVLGEPRAIPTAAAAWIPIAYLVIAGSLGAYVLFTWLLKVWPATNASYVGVVVPVIAVILGALVRAERPAPLTFVGAAIVIGAVVYALASSEAAARRREAQPPRAAG
ncbi:MAG TPA: EamA family transporter [Candidatus Limnocylindria bacterium]|nr:EamA family transporter [Candidatus Limnocylindria bacterium]